MQNNRKKCKRRKENIPLGGKQTVSISRLSGSGSTSE